MMQITTIIYYQCQYQYMQMAYNDILNSVKIGANEIIVRMDLNSDMCHGKY